MRQRCDISQLREETLDLIDEVGSNFGCHEKACKQNS
jgi:hypothetical protein